MEDRALDLEQLGPHTQDIFMSSPRISKRRTELMDAKLAPLTGGVVTHYEAERLKQELAEA
jgi:hypothetical protein